MWGITFGLPFVYHYDEHYYINTALNLGAGVFYNPPYHPTGYSNLLFPGYAAYYLAGRVTGWFTTPQSFEMAYRRDPTVWYMMGRLTTVASGVATVLALYVLGKTIGRTKTGLVAAGFLAVSFLHVRDSHYAVPAVTLSFFVVLAVSLAAAGLHRGSRRMIYLAGLAGGLAIAVKWTSFPVAVPVWWASACIESQGRKGLLGKLVNRTVVLTLLCLAVGFAAASPQVLINPAPYLGLGQQLYQESEAGDPAELSSVVLDRLMFYGAMLFHTVGPVWLVLGVAGALWVAIRGTKGARGMNVLLLSFPGVYLALIGSMGYYWLRYLVPLVPFIAWFAAEAVVAVWRARSRIKPGWALAALVIVAAVVPPLSQSARHGWLLSREDTRTEARRWIEANIPEDSKIAIDWPVHGPSLASPEWGGSYFGKTYDVRYIQGLSWNSLTEYKESGYDYLVASSYIYRWYEDGVPPERSAFYASLDDECTLVQEFRSYRGDIAPPYVLDQIYGPVLGLWRRVRPGPTLKIYRIQ
jgi:hypothetical protein